ncbi:MAG: anthranilate phosphoribosyltransferase [Muribaculaceae bacterium]|nr:anthranilate phosphoribosyltransferase [Muribaculaceae bacterium]
MNRILSNLFEHKSLSRKEARDVMLNIADGKYNDNQLSAFMTVYLMRSITAEELSGFRDAILERRVVVDLGEDGKNVIDIVGTGGDGKNTFNISTAACFVVAGAGRKVVKHGNYGSSSISGSSNVLEHHGVKFTDNPERLQQSLEESGVSFLHAPFFSPALKSVGPVRRSLRMRTFFNMLGPLVNPTMPKNQLLGVYNLKLMRLYRYIAQNEGINCTIVHSLDGYDEISLTSSFKICNNFRELVLEPESLGFARIRQEELSCGQTIDEASDIFDDVLAGRASEAKKNCVIANAAFALSTLTPELPLDNAISIARESLESGGALDKFEQFVKINS